MTPASPAPVVCRAAHAGHAVGTVHVSRHRSSATLSFTPRRDARLTFQVRPTHRAPRPTRHSRLRACHVFSLALPTGHGTVNLSAQTADSREKRSVHY